MRRRRVLLALASLVAALLVAEVAASFALGARYERGVVPRLRWLDVGLREPLRGWAMRPALRAEIIGPHPPYHVVHDSRGYRQVERPRARSGGALRVVALGDSIVYGWGVEAAERFTDLLEARLTERLGRPVEVWNLGVPGYSTDQELWTYELDGRELRPDVVLLCLAMNDVPIAQANAFGGLGKPRFVKSGMAWHREEPPADLVRPRAMPWLQSLSRCSAAAAWIRERREPPAPSPLTFPERIPWEEAAVRSIERATAAYAASFLDPDAPVHEALRALSEQVRADGAQLLLFSVPFNHDPQLMDPRFEAPPEGRLESALSRAIHQFASATGAHFATVDAAFGAETARGTILHVGDGHPNARANTLIADALEPVLEPLLRAVAAPPD